MSRPRLLAERITSAAKSRLLRPVRKLQGPLDPRRPEPKGVWMAKRSPFAYVVVPKSGCTTAGQYLYYADHGRYYFDDVHRLRLGLFKASVDPIALQRRIDKVGDRTVGFTFVRDPYTRLVSGFLDKVTDVEQAYRPELRARLQSDWGLEFGPGADQVSGFRAFVRFVEYQHELEARQDPDSPDERADWQKIDLHWRSQWWYLQRGHRVLGDVDFVGTIETMQDDLAVLSRDLAPRYVPELGAMPRFGAGPKRAHPLADYFDDATKAIVDSVYERDFELFGYSTIVGESAAPRSGYERADQVRDWVETR